MTKQNMYNSSKQEYYTKWQDMNYRCNNPKSKEYKNYGARGIKVCPEWHRDNPDGLQNYNDYIKTKLDPQPDDTYSIDRIDNDGDYEPGNLRWASKSEQNRNTQVLPAHNTSGRRGASLHKQTGRYQARIQVNNDPIFLGRYDTALEAAIAYDRFVLNNKLDHTTNGLLEDEINEEE